MILCLCASFCSITQTIGHIIIKVAFKRIYFVRTTNIQWMFCVAVYFSKKKKTNLPHKKVVNLLVLWCTRCYCESIGKLGAEATIRMKMTTAKYWDKIFKFNQKENVCYKIKTSEKAMTQKTAYFTLQLFWFQALDIYFF